MEAAGKTLKARPAPTEAEQLQRAGGAFDRMDANKDGTVTKAEFDAAKSLRGGERTHSRKH
ncbi:MAG: EF-hand domain-containing protein [Thermomonas sp.]